MIDYYQGPGRNITFCSITTGLNIDPSKGYWARELYQWFKEVISEKAELHYEHRTIREIQDVDASGILPGYSSAPRTLHQFLFGIVEHSNPWVEENLQSFIDSRIQFRRSQKPEHESYSIDWTVSQENGFKLFQNQVIALTNVWVEQMEFYYSNKRPVLLDGEDGDVWFVADGKAVELWIKSAFKWFPLQEYVKTVSPSGMLTFSNTDPGNTSNSWWLDLTGLSLRKYNAVINTWEAPATSITASTNAPSFPSDGDLWINISGGKWQLYEYDAPFARFERRKISQFPVQDRLTNSAFVGTPGSENFVIVCGDDALRGEPVPPTGGGGDLEVRKDGVTVATMVDCLNFKGPDLEITSGPGCVSIEHLPVTTLPEQGSNPSAVPDSGRLFTKEISGITELFYIDDSGNIIQITNNGSTVQNIYLHISTASATAGQTIFPLPATAKAVLTVKINGVDTIGWTYTPTNVTYNPTVGGYVIQNGDIVTAIYYE
jgi:hypothetical protein